METLWVWENVKRNKNSYGKLQLTLLVSSVSLWRKYHPKHKTVFYCDDLTRSVIDDIGFSFLWDDIRILEYPEMINREIFWSSPKTKIISETNIPIILVDHDFLIFRNIDDLLSDEIIYTYDEIADNWYPSADDIYNKRLSNPIERVNNLASNVSLFYLPDPSFSRKYGSQVLKNHEEFTSMNASDMTANHMILSEQLMLKQWLSVMNIKHQCLSRNLWDCKKIQFSDDIGQIGIWDKRESRISYKHYGVEESRIRDGFDGYNYDETILFLKRCIKAGNLIDIDTFESQINKIKNK